MDEVQNLLQASIQSEEFGPFFDWLEERGFTDLKTRIIQLRRENEPRYLNNIYLDQLDTTTVVDLNRQAGNANQLLSGKQVQSNL